MRSYFINRWNAVSAIVAGAVTSVATAGATAYDLAPVSTGVTAQVQEALTTGLPIMGALVSLGLGIRLVRRFFHA